ncbi:MAG: dienelactone hydrolase family protein [Pirellulales bacterium]
MKQTLHQLLVPIFLLTVILAVNAEAGDPPEWLSEVAIPLSNGKDAVIQRFVPTYADALQLRQYQQVTLAEWSKFLGAFEHRSVLPKKFSVLERWEHEPGIARWLIEYETEPGQQVQAFLLMPSEIKEKLPGKVKLPGVVVFHSTVDNSLFQPVGLSGKEDVAVTEAEMRKAYALHLARQGYVTISPRNYLWPKNFGIAAKEQAAAFQKRSPDRTGMARMLLDGHCAVDILCSLDQVDSSRIGVVGHSLGAKEALYLAAFDPRVIASVSCEGGLGIGQSNWDAPWYLGAGCVKSSFDLNHHQLVAAIAPRAFLLIGGQSADGDASLPLLQEAYQAYVAAGKPEHLGFYNHCQGHVVTEQALQRSLEWLHWRLK